MKSNREHLERTREVIGAIIRTMGEGLCITDAPIGSMGVEEICEKISQGIQSILDTGYPLIIQTQYTRDHHNYNNARSEIEKRIAVIISNDSRVKNWNFGMIKGKCYVSISRENTYIQK